MDDLNRYYYKMSEDDVGELLKATVEWPGLPGGSTADAVKLAWAAIGRKMGFDPSTVIPNREVGNRFFSAILIETEEQKTRKKERQDRIYKLKQEIEALSTELGILEEDK